MQIFIEHTNITDSYHKVLNTINIQFQNYNLNISNIVIIVWVVRAAASTSRCAVSDVTD
jgi:hypothetical protein